MKVTSALFLTLGFALNLLGTSAMACGGSHSSIGVGLSQAMAYCSISGGTTSVGQCQVANIRTNVWTCVCQDNCLVQESGISFPEINQLTRDAIQSQLENAEGAR